MVVRKVVVDGRKIFCAMAFANCEAIEFLRHVRYGHGHTSFVSTHCGELEIFLQPLQREIRVLKISLFDSLPLDRKERSRRWSAQQCIKQCRPRKTEGFAKN